MEVSEEVLEFKDPFEFFKLDTLYQEDYLLKSDLESIQNLCNAVALSKDPGAVAFFQGLCNSYQFWRKKFRRDFPELFEEALRVAEGDGVEDQVEYWRGKYIREVEKAEAGMIKAMKEKNITDFSEYLKSGVDPNTRMDAWVELKGPVQKEARARGYSKNATIKKPVLIWASVRGYDEFVRKLLQAGADVNIQDETGDTALIAASQGRHPKIVEMLLEAGADVNIKDKNGDIALQVASRFGGGATMRNIEMLLEKDVDPNTPMEDWRLRSHDAVRPVLTWASARGYDDFVRRLLEAGADVNAQDDEGITALLATSQGRRHSQIVEMLLEAGADPNLPDEEGDTALTVASRFGNTEIVEMLLGAGADVEASMYGTGTPLVNASKEGYDDVVRLLLNAGADVSAEDHEEVTALVGASSKGHLGIVKMLLEAGADRNNLDTALWWASENGHTKIVKMLKEAMRTPASLATLSRRSLRRTGRGREIPEYLL